MRLFYSTGTSSMACIVAVKELGIECELVEVSWSRNANVDELNRLNPLGTVPTLVLDDGKALTQNTAVLQYLGEVEAKDETFLPKVGTWERLNVVRWLAFVAADFHKAFTVAFQAENMATGAAPREIEAFARKTISAYLAHLDASLSTTKFIAGEHFSIADCYLVVVLGWCEWLEISLAEYRNIERYLRETAARSGTQAALRLE